MANSQIPFLCLYNVSVNDLKLSSKTFDKHVRNAQTQNLEQKKIWKPKAPFLKNIINCLAPTKEKKTEKLKKETSFERKNQKLSSNF